MTFVLIDDGGYVMLEHMSAPILTICPEERNLKGLFLFHLTIDQMKLYDLKFNQLKIVGVDAI